MRPRLNRCLLSAALCAAAVAACLGALPAQAVAPTYHTNYRLGKIVRIPASIPHIEGAMIDRRLIKNLRYLAAEYPILVVEGYAGPLKGVGVVGCPKCHVTHSDHYNGLATDIVPLRWDGRGCDRSWKGITRLALWAEPRQNRPRLPFRWVGYNRDEGHGCGDHLHLSWEHAPAKRYKLADWVDVFDVPGSVPAPEPTPEPVPPPVTGGAGARVTGE
jgi:hypothetical protein